MQKFLCSYQNSLGLLFQFLDTSNRLHSIFQIIQNRAFLIIQLFLLIIVFTQCNVFGFATLNAIEIKQVFFNFSKFLSIFILVKFEERITNLFVTLFNNIYNLSPSTDIDRSGQLVLFLAQFIAWAKETTMKFESLKVYTIFYFLHLAFSF